MGIDVRAIEPNLGTATGARNWTSIIHPLERQDQEETLDALKIRAKALETAEDAQGAIAVWRQVIEVITSQKSLVSMVAAEAYRNLAINLYENGNIQESLASSNQSMEILAQLNADEGLEGALGLMNIGRCYRSLGEPALAEQAFTKAGRIIRKELGEGSDIEAINLTNLASLYSQLGNLAAAEDIYRQTIKIFSDKGDEGEVSKATAEQLLANIYIDQGRLTEAGNLLAKAIEIFRRRLGEEHIFTAITIDTLGKVAKRLGEYDKAEAMHQRSLAITENRLGDSHIQTAQALIQLASLYAEKGNIVDAERHALRALSIYKSSNGDAAGAITAKITLAVIRANQGRYEEAETLYNGLIREAKSILGDHSSITRSVILALAQLYAETGRLTQAKHLYMGLIRSEKNEPPQSTAYQAELYSAFGELLSRQGDLGKALHEIRQSLNIRISIFGELNPLTIESHKQLAAVCRDLGLASEAEGHILRALMSSAKVNGEKSVQHAAVLNELGALYASQRSHAKARDVLDQALDIYVERMGSDHPAAAVVRVNLANNLAELGSLDKALALYEDARSVLEHKLGGSSPETLAASAGIAYVYLAMNKAGNALAEYIRSENQLLPLLGAQHPDTLRVGRGIAICYELLRQNANAIAKLRELAGRTSLMLQINAPLLPSGFRQEYAASARKNIWGDYAYASSVDSGADLALFSRLNMQGLLEEIERRQLQLASLSGDQRSIAQELRALTQQLAVLNITPDKRRSLRSRQTELEIQLYRLLPELKPRIVEVREVAAALPTASILVEFQRFEPDEGHKPLDQRLGSARYLALILKPDASITAVDLGLAAPIEARIRQALTASEEQLDDAESLWAAVGDLILDPLTSATRGAQTLFISPDAELNRIPFAALPAPGSEKLLGETIQLRLVTTGRELVDLANPAAQPKSAPLVVANPDFDYLGSQSTALGSSLNGDSRDGIGQQRSADLATLHWAPLPATAQEGQAIAELTKATLLTQQRATSRAIQQQLSPKLLHIASHAYFLADQQQNKPSEPALMRSTFETGGGLRTATIKGENPLLRSGIALAGANRPTQATSVGDDDGYLTALEVTQLDWRGTELVVVSACESGKGDIQAGEGVYGLKRAIAVAGARSSLLSLWKVDDAATSAFMQAFYGRLKAGQSRADALADTQRQFRQHPIPAWRHPYVWAAFQLSGDWRAINW